MANSLESTICSKCGKSLDLKTATKIDEMKDEKIIALEENMENVCCFE